MAKLTIRYTCGCGFGTSKQKEAEDHADIKKHVMLVGGMVRPSEGAIITTAGGPQQVTSVQTQDKAEKLDIHPGGEVQPAALPDESAAFEALRQKLRVRK
jgi:hypothetical protein